MVEGRDLYAFPESGVIYQPVCLGPRDDIPGLPEAEVRLTCGCQGTVIFSRDNGACQLRGKCWLYDQGLLVPLIIHWPGKLKPNTVNDDLVSMIVISATILDVAGVDLPDYLDGHPILGPKARKRDPTNSASRGPITVPLNVSGNFTYTRRDANLTGWTYKLWTSTDLVTWTEDTGASQTPGSPDANDVETVSVTISPALLTNPKLFVRMEATEQVEGP